MRTIEAIPGDLLYDVLRKAWELAGEETEAVRFDFNGTEHRAAAGETWEECHKRAEEIHGHPILTREQTAERARRDLEETKARQEREIAEAGASTEAEMREADVPWLDSEEELLEYIAALVDRPHDYGTCVYATSMAAVAAFRYAAGKLGITGFQASAADMDVLRRTRRMDHGFRVVNYADILYPQYWDGERAPIFEGLLNDEDSRERIAKMAAEKLAENGEPHPNVRRHWERLAGMISEPEPAA